MAGKQECVARKNFKKSREFFLNKSVSYWNGRKKRGEKKGEREKCKKGRKKGRKKTIFHRKEGEKKGEKLKCLIFKF